MNEQEAKYGFAAQLASLTDEQLVECFNREVGNRGWVSARGYFIVSLVREFEKRQIDCSSISADGAIQLDRPIQLTQTPRRVDPVGRGSGATA